MKDHRKEEVVQLAEIIFAQQIDLVKKPMGNDKLFVVAKASFRAAMAFRDAEAEIFDEK